MQGFTDFVVNDGKGNYTGIGEVGERVVSYGFDAGLMRPYLDKNGQAAVTIRTGRWTVNKGVKTPIREHRLCRDLVLAGKMAPTNNATTLPRETWVEIDDVIVKATRLQLVAFDWFMKAGVRSGFDAMAKRTIEYYAMTDPGEAVMDMDVEHDARRDRPKFVSTSIPLPVTHSDFDFSEREILSSKTTNTSLDTTMAEAAGRRCVELVEKVTIGTETGPAYGTRTTGQFAHRTTSQVYGLTNFPYRVTKTDLHTPTSANPENVLEDILEMRQTMYDNGFSGPFVVLHSAAYDRFLDDDYFRTGGTTASVSTRARLLQTKDIQDVVRLPYLTSGYQLIMVALQSDVVQAVNGMEITTVQWDEKGGLRKCFKVMCIKVPILKAPYNGVAGVIHGTTS